MNINNRLYKAILKGLNEALTKFDLDDFDFNDEVKPDNIKLDRSKSTKHAVLKSNLIENVSIIQSIIYKLIDKDKLTKEEKQFFNANIKQALPYIKKHQVFNENIHSVVKSVIKQLGNKCNLNWIDTLHVVYMDNLFQDSKFNGDISEWDVSNVTDMHLMFEYSKFNGDISKWDVSNVIQCWSMFQDNVMFNQDISNWNMPNLRSCANMFLGATNFRQDLSHWKFNTPLPFRDSMFWQSGLHQKTEFWPCNYFS